MPTRGDWRLLLIVPLVAAVACIRVLRWRMADALIRAAVAIAPDPPHDDARHDRIVEGVAAAIASAHAGDRGGAT